MKKTLIVILLVLLKSASAFAQPTNEVPADPGLTNLVTQKTSLKVYPVPSTGKFEVKLSDQVKKETNVVVIDRNGRYVTSQKAKSSEILFDLTNYPKGLYYVRTNHDNRRASVKVMIN